MKSFGKKLSDQSSQPLNQFQARTPRDEESGGEGTKEAKRRQKLLDKVSHMHKDESVARNLLFTRTSAAALAHRFHLIFFYGLRIALADEVSLRRMQRRRRRGEVVVMRCVNDELHFDR
jgi:hypothetical protein